MVPVSSTSQPFNYWIIVIVVIVIMLAVMFVVMTWTKGKKKGVPKELQEPPKTGEEKK
jgi:flagellar basal body-associated protein FliL